MMTRTVLIFSALLATPLLLSGCVIKSANDFDIYDSSTVNPDRFVQQIRPVWDRPAPRTDRKIVMYESDLEARATTTTSTTVVATQAEFPVVEPATSTVDEQRPDPFTTNTVPRHDNRYGQVDDGGHWLPAIPVGDVGAQYLRREVSYDGSEAAGTIVVDTRSRHLYLVLEGNRAMRYGVGIGRMGYSWKGTGRIQYKKTWPRWTPSEDYVADKPAMKMFSASYGGLVGGTNNPLGARALYIFKDGKDTLYRVHGTPDWKSVGKQVSSGCIRMLNQDVIDLYNRVGSGARIIVK